MPLRRSLLFAVFLLGLFASQASAAAVYPDLQTLPPRDMYFARTNTSPTSTANNDYVLRFTNTVWNAGPGELQIYGNVDPSTGTAPAVQKIDNGDGTYTDVTIGSYVIHPQHQHFHYDNWGRYELWKRADWDAWVAAGRPSNQVPPIVGSKTTSCVLDEEFIRDLPGTPWPRKWTDGGCDPTQTGKIDTGLSVGYGDTYDHYRYDQWIDLGTSPLADGDYILRSIADPENKVYESPNKADASREGPSSNEAISEVKVVGNRIQDLQRPTGTITINDVRTTTSSPNVTLRVLGRDDVAQVDANGNFVSESVKKVRISNDGVKWKEYAYGGSGSSPMTITWDMADPTYGGTTQGGTRTVYAQLQDVTGKWSASETDTIDYTGGGEPDPSSNSLYKSAVLSSYPTSYWRLGEASGTTANDERSTMLGTYVGSPTLGVTGLLNSDLNKAARFGGAAYVNVNNSGASLFGSNLSVEAWVRPDALPASGQFASIVTRPEAYSMQFNGNRLEFTIIQNGVRQRLQAPAGAVQVGQVAHVMGTYDGKNMNLYVNGQPAAAMPLTGPASPGWDALYIGTWDGTQEYFRGTVDEVAVYGSTLTGLQAKQHYDAGVSTAVGVATPSNLSATAKSTSQVDLAWTDNSNNESNFVLERATNSSFTGATSITLPANTTSYSNTGLNAGTQYWYRVKAITASDTSGYSGAATATTQSSAASAPAAPTTLAATATSTSQIALTWADNAADETGYVLERSTSSTFSSPTTTNLAANATSATVSGLNASTTYFFRVKAVNGTLSSAYSNTANATTQTAPVGGADYASTVAADAPVSFWRLGETAGTAAADVRGLNPGIYKNSPFLGEPGLINGTDRSVRFDGAVDWTSIADSNSLDLTTAFSIETWIKPDALPTAGNWASVASKAESYSLQFNGPQIEFTLIQNGTRRRLDAPTGSIVAGRTYHVVATYDGATQRLYINGALVASRAQTGPATVTSWPLAVASWNGTAENFRGTVDELAVYDKTLAAARVQAHYTAGAPAGATATAASRRISTRRVVRNAKAPKSALGPAQRLTLGLRGPGKAFAARARSCRTITAAARRYAAPGRQAHAVAAARRACAAARRVAR